MNKKGKHPLKRLAVCAVAMSVALLSASCGKVEEKPLIYVIGQSKGIQFWDMVQSGAEDAGKELSYDIHYENAQSTSDTETQKQLIKQAIQEKASAIVFAPNDPEALNDDLAQAEAAGIKLVAIDAPTTYKVSYIGTDNTSAGEIAGRNGNSKALYDKGKVAIIKHSETSTAAKERVDGFITGSGAVTQVEYDAAVAKAIDDGKETPNYPIIVMNESCGGEQDKAKELALQAMEENSDLSLIYTTNEKSTLGACEAVREKGMGGKVKVIGFNSHDDEIKAIADEILTGTIVQSPYNMGYLGVRYAGKLLDKIEINGEMVAPTIPANIDTGATYIDKTNINQDISQLLLYPDTYGVTEDGGEEANG